MELKPPAKYEVVDFNNVIFLAGSIEMGSAIEWQDKLVKALNNPEDVLFLNPRRDDWDSSWVQSITNEPFVNQVTWELEGLERADLVVFYFDPNTKSPITLLELGLIAGFGTDCIIYCPEPFWRKGNVDIVADRYGMLVVDSFEQLINSITDYIS